MHEAARAARKGPRALITPTRARRLVQLVGNAFPIIAIIFPNRASVVKTQTKNPAISIPKPLQRHTTHLIKRKRVERRG
jgi:hypothetical protein